MNIISRARWGARHKRGFTSAPLPASEVWLHHSVTIAPDLAWVDADRNGVEDDEERAMRTLEDIGQQRFGGGISYTFAVMPSGRVYEGHGVDRQGAHTGGRNSIARAIVLVGDYSRHQLTEAQIRAVAALLQLGGAEGWWRHARLNGGHQQAPGASTACPGKYAMAAMPRINQLATGGPITGGGFLMALSDKEQELVLTAAKRTMGMLQQRYWAVDSGTARQVGAKAPGAKPAAVLDTLDGSSIMGRLAGLEELVRQLLAGEQLDAARVEAAAEAGTRRALEDGVVQVDVSINHPEGN